MTARYHRDKAEGGMSGTKDTGGSAFPSPAHSADKFSGHAYKEFYPASPGMTLRDYFAAAALTGAFEHYRSGGLVRTADQSPQEAIASGAYQLADAMLAERAKGGGA